MPQSRSEQVLVMLSRWRVDVAWLGVLALPWSHPTRGSIAAGLPLIALGVALRVWARGHLERAEMVTTGGPYAHVRHPLYVGSFLIALAFAAMTKLGWLTAVVAVAFVAMYVPKALREEAYLRRRFGPAYGDYAARVGAVMPTWVVPRLPSTSGFAWRRVMRHREWHTWVGVAVLLAVLCGLAVHDARDPHRLAGDRDARPGAQAAHRPPAAPDAATVAHTPASR